MAELPVVGWKQFLCDAKHKLAKSLGLGSDRMDKYRIAPEVEENKKDPEGAAETTVRRPRQQPFDAGGLWVQNLDDCTDWTDELCSLEQIILEDEQSTEPTNTTPRHGDTAINTENSQEEAQCMTGDCARTRETPENV
ncbi:uncharacterized protein LOC116609371 [Nematostella vectensis]|uniref:uncharacterized protein LOC116609371 n=1 Tax=Nematostella vectensis TaxID=45351 RepID=UPI00138FF1BB|nr:uncharacterized protein LOC116609371 [Nematostella vectensis]